MNGDTFIQFEGGRFVGYEQTSGKPSKIYESDRLAFAYSLNALQYKKLGPIADVMRWASEERERLRACACVSEAEDLTVIHLPNDIELRELNLLLLRRSEYVKTFLQKLKML